MRGQKGSNLLTLIRTEPNNGPKSPKYIAANYFLTVEQLYSGTAAFVVANRLLGAALTLARETHPRSDKNLLPRYPPGFQTGLEFHLNK